MTFLPESPPDAPSTSQPATFQADADAFLAWMARFASDIEAVGGLLEPGAFGLGVMDGMTSVDVDDMDTAPSGFGRISGNTTGVRPTGVTSGAVLTLTNQYGRSSQLVFRAASNRVYARTKHDGVWRQWSEIFCSENLIGTVSHSGGTPTGAVIERGSNANGEYVRFADGTQLCWHRQGHDGNAWTNAIGSLFTATNSSAWSFPAAFFGVPTCHASAERDEMVALGVALRDRNSTSVEYTPWSAVSIGLGNIKAVHLFAVGRWF